MSSATTNSGVGSCADAPADYSIIKPLDYNNSSTIENNKYNINIQSKGSTGRIEPQNLIEQLSMEQVKPNPLEGAVKLDRIKMTDPRWLAEDGWVKMQNIVKHSDGTSTNIHFVFNEITGAFDDFKFK